MADDNHNKGIDLSGRFNDSGTGVQFQNEWRPAARASSPSTPRVVRWVMENSGGYVKDEKQASYVLLGLAAAAIVVSLWLLLGRGGGPNVPLPRGAKIIYPPGEPPRLEKPLLP
ncbi:MAG: hypothetical protein AAB604_01830 [Patescibacteria group bacterium]